MAFAKGTWTEEEHDRFLQGLSMFAHGPWKEFSDFVGTRSARQVQTHAQKYHQKIKRHERGLRKIRLKVVRTEHRIDGASSAPSSSVKSTKEEEEESPRSTDILVDWEIPPLDLAADPNAEAEEPNLLLEDVSEYFDWTEVDVEVIRELANDAELALLNNEDRELEDFFLQMYAELDEQQS